MSYSIKITYDGGSTRTLTDFDDAGAARVEAQDIIEAQQQFIKTVALVDAGGTETIIHGGAS